MSLKNNKFIYFYIISIILLILILASSFPISDLLKTINPNDNQFVKNQMIINPKAKSKEIIDRKIMIKLNAEIENNLEWDFKSIESSKEILVGENNAVRYIGKNLSDKIVTVTADFIASPEKIIPYLIKTECFCLVSLRLGSNRSALFHGALRAPQVYTFS